MNPSEFYAQQEKLDNIRKKDLLVRELLDINPDDLPLVPLKED